MILQKLKLCAFGPFKNETIIEFKQLNKAGIFLLTGPTGVGKTSIFDAIIFALYGEVSNTSGIVEKVRSDFASNEMLTYVELSFSVNNKDFFIRREPTQIKLGRSDKETEHTHQAFLKSSNISLTGVKEVNTKIEEILGLNVDQFRQIVMIPQGEFIRLLTAKSEEKGEILGKIFKTNEIIRFQENLNEKVKTVKLEIDEIKTILNTKLSMIELEDEEYQKVINTEYVNYPDAISMVSKYINHLFDLKNESEDFFIEQERLFKKKANELNKAKDNNEKIVKLKDMKRKFQDLKVDAEEITKMKRSVQLSHFANYGNKLEEDIQKIEATKDEINYKNKLNETENLRLQETISDLKKQEATIPDLKQKLEQYKEKVYELKDELKKQEKYKSLFDDYQSFPEKINKINGMLDQLNEEYQNNLEEIATLDGQINNLNLNNNAGLNDLKNKLELKLEEINDYKNLTKEIDIKNNDLKVVLEEYNAAEEKYKTQKMRLDDAKKQNEKALAYHLADNLKDGEMCPVCGSTHHPFRAKKIDENNETKTIPLMEERLHNLSAAIAYKNGSIGYIRNNIDEMEKRLKKHPINDIKNLEEYTKKQLEDLEAIDKEIFEMNKSSSKKEEIISRRQNLVNLNNENISKTENFRLMKQELLVEQAKKKGVMEGVVSNLTKEEILNQIGINENLIRDLEIIINEINQKLITMNNRLIELDTENRHNERRFVELTQELKQKRNDFAGVMEHFNTKDEYYQAILTEEKLKTYNEKVASYEKEYNILSSAIGEYEYMLMGINLVDVSSLENEVSILEEKMNEIYKQKTEISVRHENNEKMFIEIRNMFNKQSQKMSAYEQVAKISRVASGVNNFKMTFEKYILAVYFEDILEVANKLLLKMTNNRYVLIRNDELAKGNAKQGLDILVYDYNTGKMRDVKTLSGGESFKAALALALGLSEIIRWRSSGVEMNTMFIDEGFGMLDPESLDSAINILTSLKDDKRVIGIISHVAELKERIIAQIEFTSTIEGSNVKRISY